MTRRDHRQDDLFEWQPPAVVDRYDDRHLGGASLANRIAGCVARTLTESKLSRDDIAAQMSTVLGGEVSKGMLDAYASMAKEDHIINVVRSIALMKVTGDTRLLQLMADQVGMVVIEARFEHAVRAEIYNAKIEELEAERKASRRKWQRGLRR